MALFLFFFKLGATPVSSLNVAFLQSLSSLKGHLENVQKFEETDGNFVLLEGPPNSGICSLILKTRTIENGAEMKVCCILSIVCPLFLKNITLLNI